ncbi:MAG: transketolase [Candidatus Aenigmarchaeota archaeon]|nr:transketolase [Candidatus Aenigmarchaeota archaeon]
MHSYSVNDLELELFATEVRMDVIDMLYKAGSGHTGGSLSCTDILVSLYHPKHGIMKHDPKNPKWEERDRFILSAGHKAPALYAILAKCGYFPREKLYTLRKINSILQGHVFTNTPGVEAQAGSLGQGLSIANGVTMALRLKKVDSMVYCLLGDGEINEGQIWEAAKNASYHKLGNVCAIIDHNGERIDGITWEIYPIRKKWEAFGWYVIGEEVKWTEDRKEMELDGHDYNFLTNAFKEAKERRNDNQPTAVIVNTIKSKGIPMMENVVGSHGRAPNKIEYEDGMRYLKEKAEKLKVKLYEFELRAG